MNDVIQQLDDLNQKLNTLSSMLNEGDFSSIKVFRKAIQVQSLRLFKLSADPIAGELGEIINVNGIVKVCTTASLTAAVWTAYDGSAIASLTSRVAALEAYNIAHP